MTAARTTAPDAPAGARESPARGWTLALASLGAFMAALDVVVVATALPTLQARLGAGLQDLEWTINAYNLVFACLILTGAALGDRFGRRRMYVLGLLVFVTGSALAALSPGAGALIAARVVQGAGGALVVPLEYFRRRAFATANGVVFLQFISLIGSLFFITQLFQTGLGYSPLGAGLRILVWMAMPMLIAPAAGTFAERFGNRPFMVGGLLLQAAGLGWLAAVTRPGVGYGTLVTPLIVAGVGISLCFPTVANAVTGSVPPADVGVAAGTNSALNALGGVFGVAILAAVFAARGSYASPAAFISGFRPAEWVAAAAAAAGLVPAAMAPGRAGARA